jgi:hypothetical protein
VRANEARSPCGDDGQPLTDALLDHDLAENSLARARGTERQHVATQCVDRELDQVAVRGVADGEGQLHGEIPTSEAVTFFTGR